MLALLMPILLLGEPAPPVVGRPVDFSGAIGGPFIVQWIAQPTEVTTEEPVTLALHITGPGDLQSLPRPALGKLASFQAFAVEDLDDRFMPGDPPRREFRYRVRPRSAAVKEIPRFKFVYFNPQIVPAARGYQTTYVDAVPLIVKPRAASQPREVPGWLLQEWDERDGPVASEFEQWWYRLSDRLGLDATREQKFFPGWLIPVIALIGPPLLCGVWYAVWRRRHPDAAHLAGQRRSRAAAVALRDLKRATATDAGHVHAIVCEYLRARVGLPSTAATPVEVGQFLRHTGHPEDQAAGIEGLLRTCDRARFSLDGVELTHLTPAAERLILSLEGAP